MPVVPLSFFHHPFPLPSPVRLLLTLFTKELRSFFFSPIAYVVLALVMIINGLSFRAAVSVLSGRVRASGS